MINTTQASSTSAPPQAAKLRTLTAAELILQAGNNPPEPIITGLMNVGDILLIHGTEECFKSIFVVQMAEAIATATPLVRYWNVPHPYVVGVINTEMHEAMLGIRLKAMFPAGDAPTNMRFLGAEAMHRWRRNTTIAGKFTLISQWIRQEGIQVLLIDTANDFFRAASNPSDETAVGGFFDQLRNLELKATGAVRHDRKHKGDDQFFGDSSNDRIRGSGEWKEDPEAILFLERLDRRTHSVRFEVGKLRYGSKPELLTLWFDAECFRLIPLPPVIAVLEAGPKSRQEVLTECEIRFGLSERKVDEMLGEHKQFLRESQQGHHKVFEIDWDRADGEAWFPFARRP